MSGYKYKISINGRLEKGGKGFVIKMNHTGGSVGVY
jgi:hypothetical protein